MKFTELHMILGERNFALSITEGYLGEEHVSFYDLFRIQNNKLVEHGDVNEPILPIEESEW